MVGHRNWIPFSSDRVGSIEKAKCTILGKNYAISCDTSPLLLLLLLFCHQERRGVFDWSVLQFKEAVDFII